MKKLEKLFLPDRMIKAVKEKGLKWQNVCKAVGVSKVTMCNWKKKTVDPSFRHLIALAKFLGKEYSYFIKK